jgi:hypothetical protein
MDLEAKIKRLLVIFVLSLVVIFAAKSMLTKTVTNLGKAAAGKKQHAADSRPVPPPSAPVLEAPSPVPEPTPESAAGESVTR